MDQIGIPRGKRAYFDTYWSRGWPTLDFLKPYFFAPPLGIGWFDKSGNDSGSISIEGLDDTDVVPSGEGRKDIKIAMWGNPELGVLLQYTLIGFGPREDWFSKGDMSKIRQWTRSLHDDPLPVGLFIPFDQAWLAVKEFMDTQGQLPTSIAWVHSKDLPANSFPDPTVRLPGEPE